jgi:hypothetical protein
MNVKYRGCWITPLIVLLGLACVAVSAPKPAAVKFSEVAAVTDLIAVLEAKVSEIEADLVSAEAYQAARTRLRLGTVQLAVIAEAVAEHDDESKLKTSGASIRAAALQIGAASSFEQARAALDALHLALDGKAPAATSADYDWANLGRTRLLMESLRERTEQVRKAIRRSKDPVAESRQATTMAVLAVAVAAHADDFEKEADRMAWQKWSLDCQRELTRTAQSLREKDAAGVLSHFTAAQVACDKCHEQFKK